MAVTNYHTVNGAIRGETTGGVRTDYLTDALGSVTATLDSTGSVQNTYRHKPYGDLLVKTGSHADPSFLWVGTQGYRATGLRNSSHYVRARHYDDVTGMWTTVDPLWPQLPPYCYSRSSPAVVCDPLGLAGYVIGDQDYPFDDENIGNDDWNTTPKTLHGRLLWGQIDEMAIAFRGITPHASENLLWYLGNTGRRHGIALGLLVAQSMRAYGGYATEVNQAKAFASSLRDGIYNITSTRTTQVRGSWSDSADWYLALGDYLLWGKGTVCKANHRCRMFFFLRLHDPYDWHGDKGVGIGPFTIVPDYVIRLLHAQGLAREYMNEGAYGTIHEWAC